MSGSGFVHATDLLFYSVAGNYTGEQLKEKGWTHAILPRDQVEKYVQALAANLSSKSQKSLRLLKQHLTRKITTLVNGLGATEETSDTLRIAAKHRDIAITCVDQLRVEAHGDKILLFEMRGLEKPGDVKSMVSDLSKLFEQVNNGSRYRVVILTSEHPDFLPESASSEDVLALGAMILKSTIPIIAVLHSNAFGTGWLVGLHCDATVYQSEGSYGAGNMLHVPELAGQATMMFTRRMGNSFGQEILLTGRNYTGSKLQERVGGLVVAAHDQVMEQALELAETWTTQPVDCLLTWKKRSAIDIDSITENIPSWPLGEIASILRFNEPTPVSLKTNVIAATAHPEGVLEVRMQEREAKNMFSDALIDGMNEVFVHIEQTTAYKVVLLTGYDSYFASGGTKEGLLAIQEGKAKFTDTKIYQLAMKCKIPVIAAMQGHGIGAGWCIGMFADLILFSEESKYVSPYMNYGFTPGAGATMIFPHTIGHDLARETMLTGKEYSGSELKSRGLRHIVLPRREILAAAMDMARDIAKYPINSLIGLKRQMTQHLSNEAEEAYRLELSLHEKTFVGHSDTLQQIQKTFTSKKNGPQNGTEYREVLVHQGKKTQPLDILDITATVKRFLAEELHLREDEIDEKAQFADLGLDSIIGVSLIRKVNETYKTSIEATKIYSYPTIEHLGRYVKQTVEKNRATSASYPTETIAFNTQSNTVKHEPIGQHQRMGEHQNIGPISEVTSFVKKVLAEELHLQENEIDEKAGFVDLGLDSIIGVSLIRKINEKYKTTIEASRIYSYSTVQRLGRYVKEEAEKHGNFQTSPVNEAIKTVVPRNKLTAQFSLKPNAKRLTSWRGNQITSRKFSKADSLYPAEPIAVVGMAGQFPQANSIEEFWQNIANAKNCIREISPKRWDVDAYYQEGNPSERKTNSKWLGALEGYDLFDPHFFTISPTEAESMDPQQRLFLQTCWHTIEDAGYSAQSLSGTKCGVFVGCTAGDYQLLSREQQLSAQGFTGSAPSILAARISYFLNLQGPCLSIDTACSSSLVAIASACESLITKASDTALAGGVYVMAGPELHVKTAQSGMLSQDGRCYTFDQRANGFVPGEGVGVVMLKRLADAERDQDAIYGVIHGWGVNQDGKTNGITAPNSESQTRLEQEVYDKFGIDPNQIQLIEAHGTGTKLGDPIEVDALKQSFKKYTEKKEYCALGSVKSNIGHCLTAAGVASFIKVLMSLEHEKLPPTINYENLNEHINLKDSPFYVNTQLKDWVTSPTQRRQAAISAFGFSGTNAHLVVGEYKCPIKKNKATSVVTQNGKMIIPLSARNAEQLRAKAQDLLDFIQKGEGPIDLLRLAYTLQVARDPMEDRLALMVDSIYELVEKLGAYVKGREDIEGVFQGQVKRNKEGLKLLVQDDDIKEAIVGKLISEGKLTNLSDLWVKGLDFSWSKLYGEMKPDRIHLPLYPFAKEHYWIETKDTVQQSVSVLPASNVIHPLLHRKVEDLREQGFTDLFADTIKDENSQKVQLVNLPTYPFSRDRYWPEKSPAANADSDQTDDASLNLDFIEDIIQKVDSSSMEVDAAVNLLRAAL